jgi:hypothetical protein
MEKDVRARARVERRHRIEAQAAAEREARRRKEKEGRHSRLLLVEGDKPHSISSQGRIDSTKVIPKNARRIRRGQHKLYIVDWPAPLSVLVTFPSAVGSCPVQTCHVFGSNGWHRSQNKLLMTLNSDQL